jgi:MerR family mercuric resistance operon transcriptional regulator
MVAAKVTERPAGGRQVPDRSMTIGALATAASVGVETVRYYQRRGLVAEPPRGLAGVRRYGAADVARIGFIRRAQELGFSLEEIGTLLQLEDGADRRSIRRIAAARLAQIRMRMADLGRMERALAHVLHECEAQPGAPHCPIVEAIVAAPAATNAVRRSGSRR